MCPQCPKCSLRPGRDLFDGQVHCGYCLSKMKFAYADEPLKDTKYSLYRHYENYGRLLYVGITKRGTRRMQEHSAHSDWFFMVDYTTYVHYDTRKQALDAEWVAIRDEDPMFNTIRKPPPHWALGQTEPPPEYTVAFD